jgi:hypothetical protein
MMTFCSVGKLFLSGVKANSHFTLYKLTDKGLSVKIKRMA